MTDFERWESRFAVPDYIFGTAPNAFLAAQKHLLPPEGRALAVADGEGRNGVWLAEQGLDVHAIDFSPAALAKAEALAAARGVSISTELADATQWPWPPNAFDVVAVILTQFVGPAERAGMFAGFRTTLRSGGLLLIHGYTPKQLLYGTGGPRFVENLYTRELLEGAFGDFTDVVIREYDTEMSEGTAHTGRSAVIDFVGSKSH